MTPAPMPFRWDGEAMIPLSQRQADKLFVVGEIVRLERHEDRSAASHRQYFAALAEAHANLPEEATERLPTPEHLRKFALIRAGFRDERSIVCASKAEARRVAAFVRPLDEFAIVTASDAVVTVWTAKSQSVRAMGKAAFEDSKAKVLDFVAGLIGTTAAALPQERAA